VGRHAKAHLPAAIVKAQEAETKEAGISVHVWTVNDPEVARQLAAWDAASVVSDDVTLVGPAIRDATGATPPLTLV
jgi:glycerophosphoryl diester phosphodiesterase